MDFAIPFGEHRGMHAIYVEVALLKLVRRSTTPAVSNSHNKPFNPIARKTRSGVNGDVRRHRVSTSRIGLVPLEPDGERLVAYLERRTPWDF